MRTRTRKPVLIVNGVYEAFHEEVTHLFPIVRSQLLDKDGDLTALHSLCRYRILRNADLSPKSSLTISSSHH